MEVKTLNDLNLKQPLLTESEAAALLNVSLSFLQQDRAGVRKGCTPGPTYIKVGGSVRYHQADLDEYIKGSRVVRYVPQAAAVSA